MGNNGCCTAPAAMDVSESDVTDPLDPRSVKRRNKIVA